MDEAGHLLAELLARADLKPLLDRLRVFDGATYRHSLRVARFSILLGRADGMPAGRLGQLAVAALLHDLGKTQVEAALLQESGPLDAEQRRQMQAHAAADLQVLEAFPEAHRIAPLHHEAQGEGSYPRSGRERRERTPEGASDRRQPLPTWVLRAGRLLTLADRYDALISHRPYKAPWPDAAVREQLRAEMGDVAALLGCLPPPGRPPR